MNCPKCHGTGEVFAVDNVAMLLSDYNYRRPCDHPGCFNGQISCCEGENRDEAASVAALQIGNHQKLRLLGSVPGDWTVEKTIQGQFWNICIRGEWFKSTGPLTEYIRNLARSEGWQ